MSFQMPSQRQEQQRSKILEDLQKKQQLLKQQQSAPSQTQPTVSTQPITVSSSTSSPAPAISSTDSIMSSSQRAALQHANNNSFGFFITQDSSFGEVSDRFELDRPLASLS